MKDTKKRVAPTPIGRLTRSVAVLCNEQLFSKYTKKTLMILDNKSSEAVGHTDGCENNIWSAHRNKDR